MELSDTPGYDAYIESGTFGSVQERDEKGRFVKGMTPWNKDRHHSEEARRKISEAGKGRVPWNKGKKLPMFSGENAYWYGKSRSEETRRKISEANKGHKAWNAGLTKADDSTVRAIAESKIGIPRPDVRGEKHWKWKGGDRPYYGPNWLTQRRLARERDKGICYMCGIEEADSKHCIHHITPFKVYEPERYEEANSLENLMTLCPRCHTRIEIITEDS